jgi:DNA invertase Pin-like site-specific DNA recombinase
MNVFSYIRVSSKGQVEGDGPERQRLACVNFSQAHKLVIVSSFFDAYTGASEERPGFTELLLAIQHNHAHAEGDQRIEAVVVERMDRLARDLMASEFLLRELRKLGVKLFATDQGKLDDMASNDVDPTRILIRQILGALAQWEKAALVKKLRAAQLRAAAEGRPCGNKPYGLMEGEQDGLRQLAEWNRQGYCNTEIADMMNARGYPSRSGKPWSRHTIAGILARNGRTPGASVARKELANLLAQSDCGAK